MQPGDIIYTIYNQQRHFGIYVDESNVIHCFPLRYAKWMPLHYMASVVGATLKEFAMGRDIYRLRFRKTMSILLYGARLEYQIQEKSVKSSKFCLRQTVIQSPSYRPKSANKNPVVP